MTGRLTGSVSVSDAARSVAETTTGIIGVALGTSRTGALELFSSTGKPRRTVPLPAPARQVVVGSDGTTFYVLSGTATTSSVTIVGSRGGRILGSVPMPSDAVAVVPDVPQTDMYALERNGLVDEIDVTGGKVVAKFKAGSKGDTGQSITLSPDGNTLYVLKNAGAVSNIAEVDTRTEAVRKPCRAESLCRGARLLWRRPALRTGGDSQIWEHPGLLGRVRRGLVRPGLVRGRLVRRGLRGHEYPGRTAPVEGPRGAQPGRRPGLLTIVPGRLVGLRGNAATPAPPAG